MSQYRDNPFEGQLEVVATLRDRNIEARLNELRKEDEMTLALRQMLDQGVSIDDLSDAAGLSPAEIQRRADRELHIESDLEVLAGSR